MDKIVINKDNIQFDDKMIFPPFTRGEIEQILGEPAETEVNYGDKKSFVYVWDSYGIAGFFAKDGLHYEQFIINMNQKGCHYKYLNSIYQGKVYVGKKEYRDCSWKLDYGERLLKSGVFSLSTVFIDDCDKNDKYWEMYSRLDGVVEVCYKKPRKLDKYKQKTVDEPILTFSDFNFKLAVIQKLMYEKELLLPKFDVYEFVEEYPKREIDLIEEGYEPIKEVVDWFKKLQIPASLADEVDEIYMDGGNDVYLQIAPNWDGEDDSFDIKKITAEDLAQLKNLKKITLMSENYEKIAKVLRASGVEVC